MKVIVLFCLIFLFSLNCVFAQLGVNSDNSQPDPSAGLDVKFTNKGLLPPRVALTAITSAMPVTAPATGLLVYNTAAAGTSPNNVLPGYYSWNGLRWTPVAPPQGTNVGDMLYWNGTQWVGVTAGSNGQVLAFINGVPAWTTQCGIPFTINHVTGVVAPVSKTATYGTVSSIPGDPSKCWITSNLGADYKAAIVSDANEPPAGWYWQVNRKQGYKHDGITRTPNSGWISNINENSDWIAANDPCTIELGGTWRIPTTSEWANVDASNNWTNWNGPWNAGLKLHAGGYLDYTDGSLLSRGVAGFFWSSTQVNSSGGSSLVISVGGCVVGGYGKANGYSIRCIRDL